MAAEQDEVDAAQAFEDLRAEVSVARRAVEDLPAALAARLPPQPPDYGKDLAMVISALADVNTRLAAIEAQPALTRSPSAYAEAMLQAGETAMGSALKDARALGKTLAETIGHKRGKSLQLRWLAVTGVVALLAGLLGGPWLFGALLPLGFSSDYARIVMAAPTRWKAGQEMMKMGDPGDWSVVAAANNLVVANAKAVAACRAEAAKTHKSQECRIVVKAEK